MCVCMCACVKEEGRDNSGSLVPIGLVSFTERGVEGEHTGFVQFLDGDPGIQYGLLVAQQLLGDEGTQSQLWCAGGVRKCTHCYAGGGGWDGHREQFNWVHVCMCVCAFVCICVYVH